VTRKGFLSTVAAVFGAAPVVAEKAPLVPPKPIQKVSVGPSVAYAFTAMPAKAVSACFLYNPSADDLIRYKQAGRKEAV
jgi:hypothetical protein